MKSFWKYIILIVCCVVLMVFYATDYQGHIRWQEQNQIFLNASHWLASYFDKPAWLGCLAGEWLTQFFNNAWAGAAILTTAIALCVMGVACVLLRLLPIIFAWILTGIFAVLMIGCSMPASTTLPFFICTAGGISIGLIKLTIPSHNRRLAKIAPILVLPSFWLFGFGAIPTAIIIIAFAVKDAGIKRIGEWSGSAICTVVFTLGIPAILHNHYALPYGKAILYPGIAQPTLPQFNLEDRMNIADAFFYLDYDKTKQLALDAKDKNDITAFYYYLASAMQDSLPDNLLKYPIKSLGTLTTIGDTSPLPVINMMNDLYYELGDMTYAERAAMMRNVFSPRNRNVRMARRLAEINLVSGDTLAAQKYLRLLNRTHAYSDWSKAHFPGNMSSEVETEILHRRAFSNNKDNIRLGDNCRNIILELLESNHNNTIALDYLLCTDLLLKDMDTFKMDYDTYCMSRNAPRYKDLYQQALMIYLAGTDAPQEIWERYIVSGTQIEQFNHYSNRRGDPAFRGTYWYYFDKQ